MSDAELDRYHGRLLDSEARERVRRHLSECPACARRAESLTDEVNGLIAQMQDAGPPEAREDSPPARQESAKERTTRKPAIAGGGSQAENANEASAPEWPTIAGYRILREIGAGGMGIVFEAEQADTKRRVALKVIKGGPYVSEEAVRLFRREVQTLARLKHPGIAHIYEAGQTEQGQPYFAMEYVQGETVVRFVDSRKLPIDERLRLCAKICDAVHYAHQNAVIHRDLKPTNIVVVEGLRRSGTRNGAGSLRSPGRDFEVKVLDFGLAKITDPEENVDMPATKAGHLMGTLEYMSPKQAEGRTSELDIRTDIYSLGVLAYEILTGALPYDGQNEWLIESIRVIVERPPVRPSRLNRALRGDVEAILLKALEKDKRHRYTSAGAFAEDIERYRSHLPIVARPPSAAYQIRKFVRRHAALTGLAATVFLAVVTIAVVASVQGARIAAALQEKSRQHERAVAAEQRAASEAKRANAEAASATKRFNQVRELARSFIFDFHDKIADLAGAIPARQFLVETALRYLDSLASETSDEPSLARDLASAYLKVGDVQGNPYGANLGDTAGALRSYRKALELLEALAVSKPHDSNLRRGKAISVDRIGRIQAVMGRLDASLLSFQNSLSIVESIARAAPSDKWAQLNLSVGHDRVGRAHAALGQWPEALARYRERLAIAEDLLQAAPTNRGLQRGVALAYLMIGDTLEAMEQTDEALDAFRKGHEIGTALVQAEPDNATFRRDLATSHERIGGIQAAIGRTTDALSSYRESQRIWSALVQADPDDANARRGLSISDNNLGDVLLALGRLGEALASYGEGLNTARTLARNDPDNAHVRRDLAVSYWKLAEVSKALGSDRASQRTDRLRHLREARSWFERALGAFEEMREVNQLSPTDADVPARLSNGMEECEAAIVEMERGEAHPPARVDATPTRFSKNSPNRPYIRVR